MWVLIVLLLVGPGIPARVTFETPSEQVCNQVRDKYLTVTPEDGAQVVGIGMCEKRENV